MAGAELMQLLSGASLAPEAIDWDSVVRQARRCGLLGRLACMLEAQRALDAVPPHVRRHLDGARLVAQRQTEAVRWEVSCIEGALASVGRTTLLLKGAAYAMAGLPPSRGRLMSDIDILVPHDALGAVESALMRAGWVTAHHDAYDQHYYRRWMHELPPMRHVVRSSAVDVHHALLPMTARNQVDTEAMRAAAVPIPGYPQLRMLAPADMVLHAATHLFHEGELHSGLRDLSDLDLLLRHFGAMPGFWDELAPRAEAVGLARPLHYALTYCAAFLATPVPPAVMIRVAKFGPSAPLRMLMGELYARAFAPGLPNDEDVLAPLARSMLFLRGHWLRMPPHLLVYHLGHKAMAAMRSRPDKVPDDHAK